jgi:hypothetical protein
MRIQHWQDVASLLLGVWLVLSPFALGFAGAAVWMTIVLGLFVILFAVEGFVIPSYLEEWGEILLGLRLAAHVFGSTKLFADDTPIPVLDPGRGRTKTGRLWVYARDDRPWSGPEPPAAVYFYSPDRKAERPAAHLQDFRGVLQVDGYAGFERLTAPGDIVLAACWAHARRKFYDLHEATGSPIAAEALRRITIVTGYSHHVRAHKSFSISRVTAAEVL